MKKTKKDTKIDFYSFDIFDTLITRTTATPKGIFALIEEKLKTKDCYADIPSALRNNFYLIREGAEAAIRTEAFAKGALETTLDAIYDLIGYHSQLSQEQKGRLMRLEVETEKENTLGIDRNILWIRHLLTAGKRVVLISDMYLSSKIIRELLLEVSDIFKDIPIYVSSEAKKPKWTGDLFRFVQAAENFDCRHWMHIGDNKHCDYDVPLALGMQATHCVCAGLEPYECEIINANANNPFAQLTIGTAKYSRLAEGVRDRATVGASLGGPMLFPYVFWVLQNAQKMELKKLYFVARDGYVLKEMADAIIHELNLPIKTHYVYSSRQAWRLAGYDPQDHFAINSYFQADISPDVNTLLHHLGMSPQEGLRFLPKKYQNPNKKICSSDFPIIKEFLFKNFEFQKILEEKVSATKSVLIKYLQQEIDFSQEKIAFVEFRGTGATQECVTRLIHEHYKNEVINFFLTLETPDAHSKAFKYMMFPSGYKYIHVILEMLTRAPHGLTLGYQEVGGKIQPILDEDEGFALVDRGFNHYLEGVMLFTKSYAKLIKKTSLNPVNLRPLLSYIEFLLKKPDKRSIGVLGTLPFSMAYAKKVTDFAPPLTLKDVFMWGLFAKKPFLCWESATLKRTPKSYLALLYCIKYVRNFLEKYILDIDFNKSKKLAFIRIFGMRVGFERLFGFPPKK